MEVDVQVEGGSEALNGADCSGVCAGAGCEAAALPCCACSPACRCAMPRASCTPWSFRWGGPCGAQALEAFPTEQRARDAPATASRTHLIVDSTGLSIVREGEWAADKHGAKGRRGRKKLHLGVDRAGMIVAQSLTDGTADGAGEGSKLL